MLELIVEKQNDVEKIALIKDYKIQEFYEITKEDKKDRLEGNIYLAKVTDILPGMQAAFVDFGEEKKGFIHLKDAIPQIDERTEKFDPNLKISNVLKLNDTILIQVKKDAVETKGARVSTHISLPSKYIVYMPETRFITISQKIEDNKRKKELLDLVQKNIPKGDGAIIRTSALNAKNDEILNDIKVVSSVWQEIIGKAKKTKFGPKLILESEEIQEKMIVDLGCKGLEKVTLNNKSEYEKIKKLVEIQKYNIKVELKENKDLFDSEDFNKQIEKLQKRKIWLNCGGFITIDKTEALTAIDVNTGKFTGNKDLEKTIFKVNKEATMEISKQLRLRDIGGIIIVDYIDMQKQEDKKQIEELLKNSLKEDRAKTQVEGFTRLNLMELTRKRICGKKDI